MAVHRSPPVPFFAGYILAALVGLACGGGPAPEPPREPPPASGTRGLGDREDREDCSEIPPEGHLVAIGYGRGDEATALGAARQDARARLLGQICAGWSSRRCASAERAVRDWRHGGWSFTTRSVCATAAVDKSVVRQLELDSSKFDEDLAALAARVQLLAAGRSISVEPPTWAGPGCSAGSLGHLLAGSLRSELLEIPGLAVVVAGGGAPLHLALSNLGDRLSIAATIGSGEALPGISVPLDVLGLSTLPDPPCNAAAPRPVAASGPVGAGDSETHWIGGCDDRALETSLLAAGRRAGDGDPAALESVSREIAERREEAALLCARYERFEIASEEYVRRMADLSEWGAQTTTLLASAGPPRVAAPVQAVPLTLTVEARRVGGSRLKTGDRVREGDSFELRASTSAPAWLYVLYENSAGEQALLPPDGQGLHVDAATIVSLPSSAEAFVVDENAGRAEVVHVVATPRPVALEELTAAAVVRTFASRGLSVQKKEALILEDGGAWWGDPEEVVSGYGGVLWTLALDHR